MNRKKNIQFIIGIIIAVLIVVAVGFFSKPKAESNNLLVYILDVGQGDASYIRTPTGEDILIDGGPDNSILNELAEVMSFGDREIDLVILTHPHADHVAGLLQVLKRYEVKEVWQTGVEYPSATFDAFKDEIYNQQIPDYFIQSGDTKHFGDVRILILYPLSSLENQSIDNLNNSSIVNRLDYHEFSMIFTGDAEVQVQRRLLDDDIFADILKVPHHGGKELLDDFLSIVRPEVAIISAGVDNKYGHPLEETLNLLYKLAVRIYRTDQEGTIKISTDGNDYYISTK